ncbi:hypothetical protein ACHAWF_007065 [Thalassiosira exigua]
MTMMRLLAILAIAIGIAPSSLPRANAFSLSGSRHGNNLAAPSTLTRLRSTQDDKQTEIAALEERLRKLKEEESAPEAAPDETEYVATDEPDELDGESDDSVMFSERWKEAKDGYLTKQDEESKGGLTNIALGLAFVVFLGAFSQIPLGQEDLQRFQDVKGNPTRIDLGDLNPVQ